MYPILVVALVAVLYFVGAMLGHSLAIPPNFAAAVWPAAGVALASVMLLRGLAPAIGILIGAIVANTLNVSAGDTTEWSALIPGICISIGSVLQATAQWYLYRHFIGRDASWSDPSVLVRFSLLVAIGGSTIAATIGVTTLYFAGVITESQLPFNWVTWLIGDAVGVLLIAPAAHVIFSNRHYSLSQKLQILLPFVVILCVVYLLFLKSIGYAEERRTQILRSDADHLARTIESRLVISENKLSAYAAFFVASEKVYQDEFNEFSSIIMANDDVFHGIGWTEVLDDDGRRQWEEYFRANGYPDYQFMELGANGSLAPAKPRDLYYPVLYIYPFEQNRRAFGLNLAANPARKTALLDAAKLRRPIATAPIVLAQETEKQKAIIMYNPVFSPVSQELLGYASGVMRLDGILGESFERASQASLQFNLYDVTDERQPLYESPEQPDSVDHVFSYPELFGNRAYELQIYPGKLYPHEGGDWSSYVILTGGFIIAALFLAFVMITTGTIENISRKVKEKTSELMVAAQQANAANEAKSAFLANISHELRTPMNAIIGFIHLVLKSPLNAEQKRYLRNASMASDTLLALINQTLDYAKIEAGKMELEDGPVNIRRTEEKMQALFGQLAAEKHLRFLTAVDQSVPELLRGDYLRIEQIILNLLSNAFRFTSSGEVSLSFYYLADDGVLQIRVRDTGIGIPKEKLEHIFSAFGQVDVSTSREYGGTGLGLSISKRIAKMMNGDILVRSSVGMGSEFCVNLTLSEDTSPALVKVFTDHHAAPLAGANILVVEDVAMNQIITQELLKGFGAHAEIAGNGQEAVTLLRAGHTFDAVLMDIQMPVMDGYEATRIIRREISSDLPVIGMTANAMDSDIEHCRSLGMNAHIAKPVDPEVMLEVLRSVCGR